MVVSGSPKRWDRWHSPSPFVGSKNTTYIPLIVLAFWGVKNATYHLLGEPETTIDNSHDHEIAPYVLQDGPRDDRYKWIDMGPLEKWPNING